MQYRSPDQLTYHEWAQFIVAYCESINLVEVKNRTNLKIREIREYRNCLKRSGLLLHKLESGVRKEKPVDWVKFSEVYTSCDTMNEACHKLDLRRGQIKLRLQWLQNQGIKTYELPYIEKQSGKPRVFKRLLHSGNPQDYVRKLRSGRYETFKLAQSQKISLAGMMQFKRQFSVGRERMMKRIAAIPGKFGMK